MASVRINSWLITAGLFGAAGCTPSTTKRLGLPPLTAVDSVDLQRYSGTWYEIASYPNRFQAGCTATTAQYSIQSDGTVKVLNRCRKGGLDGEAVSATGRARTPDPQRPGELQVSFFGPFWGDYWIIQLDPEYQYAVVGQPSRDYLWILSRTPEMSDTLYATITDRLGEQSYPLAPLKRTVHPTP